jgi:DNA mismatch endonuclease (patch repair protein)
MHPKQVPGKPDFFFASTRIAVFVDGCFWHGCSRCGHVPGKNRPFWAAKLTRNQERDRETERRLADAGIRVLRFWEHYLKDNLQSCVERVERFVDKKTRVSEQRRLHKRPAS